MVHRPVLTLTSLAVLAVLGLFVSLTLTSSQGTAAGDPVIAGAGDISGDANSGKATAAVLASINPDAVFTLGDNAYEDGTLSQYRSNYAPSWGKLNSKVFPATGNHEYHTANAQGFRDYFGRSNVYYSYDIGAWHMVVLASDSAGVSNSAGSAEERWLKNDLAAHPNQCIGAYWHEPRFTSGSVHSNDSSWKAVWQDLYAAHAAFVLNGHNHQYERFAPQNPSGAADPNGIREFVVGTGGWGLYSFNSPQPNSQVRYNASYGVIKLTLHPDSYDWQFVPTRGAFTDSGTGTCPRVTAPPTTSSRTTTTTATTTTEEGGLVLPDKTITPGVLNPRVRQGTIRKTICVSGWTKKIRPPVSYTNALKLQQMQQYGETGSPSAYEEDHFIPLELGGAPRNPKNLWPEPRSQSRHSDPLETQLKRKVCHGVMKLAKARTMIRQFKFAHG